MVDMSPSVDRLILLHLLLIMIKVKMKLLELHTYMVCTILVSINQ